MSTLKFNAWEKLDGTPGGAILQVKHTLYTTPTSQALTAITETALTGIEVAITPYRVSSRFLIMSRWTGEVSGNVHNMSYFITRNGTKINCQETTGNRASGSVTTAINYASSNGPDNNSTPDFASIYTIDTPNTTSEIVYRMACIGDTAKTIYTNRTIADTDSAGFERTTSEIIVMEIAV